MPYVKRIIQAGAGTGKTTLLIKEALINIQEGKVLYLTYTRNNLRSMKDDILKDKGFIPKEIECRTWIEFLLNELAKPYRKLVEIPAIEGLDNTMESKIPKKKGVTTENVKYYINRQNKLYSERLAQLICEVNNKINGMVFNRINKMYSTILIDEVQDLNGYDLEIVKELYNLECNIIIVGDHRQSTYSTNSGRKHSKYKNSKIFNFFKEEMSIKEIEQLNDCYRCNQEICDFVNPLYDDLELRAVRKSKKLEDEGIILIENQSNLLSHIQNREPTILHYDKRIFKKAEKYGLPNNLEYLTFGTSKGVTRDHVLIFPTSEMKNHAMRIDTNFKEQSLAKYYVALTRARHSVAIYIGK
ncbi:UvrD-helicase domain-containing protein [Geomicrobium sediminis]|uniref:DNA helicase-2/ATP-dependent DNA helicase PcrA n=1 Tax=Geomicrobium sediminis TaxID=1347788 RepID=A0ABS2PD12_9BACL|nr:UvrD-helicase domain-containing protein [Geomicrobium sediminis]MBM7632683.1 DNA helicase-2/ATP-dependent DNA helicase PcrA [Geomicrobium sediminis]